MNILIISQYYNPDPFRLHEAAEGLAKKGHKVTVLTGTPNYISKESVKSATVIKKSGKENGVEIIRVPTLRRRMGKISLGLSYLTYIVNASIRAIFLKRKVDVVFVYQLSPIFMIIPAWIVKAIKKKKLVLYSLDLWPESIVGGRVTHNSFIYKVVKDFSIKAYESVDCLAYTSELFKKYFLDDLKINQMNYEYIPQFAEDIYSSIEHVSHEGINYIFAGNIGEAQSVETIVRAAAATNNSKIRWHIVGDGRSYQKCIDLAKELNVADKVVFYGRKPIEEMPRFYSIADALLVTLADNDIISYTLPGKVQSYMASGIPILAAASGETQNVINNACCGFCCASEDSEGLAKAAEKMAVSDREIMGMNAKKYYQEHFTKQKYINSIEELLLKNTIGEGDYENLDDKCFLRDW